MQVQLLQYVSNQSNHREVVSVAPSLRSILPSDSQQPDGEYSFLVAMEKCETEAKSLPV